MEIISTDRQYTPRELYRYTADPAIKKMSVMTGCKMPVDGYVMYEDVNRKTGEVQTVLAVRSGDQVYATNSPTFINDFSNLLSIFGEELIGAIEVCIGTSKAGREFLFCRLAD